MDHVLLLPLLVLLLSDGTTAFCNDSQPGGKSIQQLLKDALLNNPHNLNQLETYFPTGDLSPVTCVPVTYTIQPQQENTTVSNASSIGPTYTFLWTTFDTAKNIPGKFLLIWSFRGTLVLGFDWEDSCKFDVQDTIFLHIDGTNIDLTNVTTKEISEALENITLELKMFTETGGNITQSNGFVREWSKDSIASYYCSVAGLEAGIYILCVMMTISFGHNLFNLKTIQRRINQDKTHIVLYTMCSFLFLASSWMWIIHPVLVHINVSDHENRIRYICIITFIYVSNCSYFIVAVLIYRSQQKSQFCCKDCQYISGVKQFPAIAAIAISLSFLTHVFFAIPSIALAFYAFPSRTIIRLSYFELALFCLFLGVIFLFKQLHKLTTCTVCLCFAVLQILTVIMLLMFLSIILVVAGGIVFEATSDEVRSINDYLLILPTIAVNIILLAIHPKGLRNRLQDIFFSTARNIPTELNSHPGSS